MSVDAKPKTYPKISRKMWWLLRTRFMKSIPTVLTPTLVDTLSTMSDSSARSNVLAPMRELGLIDADNKPTELAQKWRHDEDYPAVCIEIRDKIYPADLIEAFPEAASENKESIKNWFMKKGQVGEAAARMYADTYILLSQADPAQSDLATVSSKRTPVKAAKKEIAQHKPQNIKATSGNDLRDIQATIPPSANRLPAIHIDVQVHISPETSPEQIDRIFESMAKHLGSFTK